MKASEYAKESRGVSGAAGAEQAEGVRVGSRRKTQEEGRSGCCCVSSSPRGA